MNIAHPIAFAVALLLAAAGIVITSGGSDRTRGSSRRIVLSTGLLLLALAAGGVSVSLHPHTTVTVLVDLSPSTRGAAYRDRPFLEHRIQQLVGTVPYSVQAFSDSLQPLPDSATLPDLPCERTEFPSVSADAVLLFSDGVYEAPAVSSAPTFPVIDPKLDDAADARVTDLSVENSRVQARVTNTGPMRTLQFRGIDQSAIQISTGSWLLPVGTPIGTPVSTPTTGEFTAAFNGEDRWPENDSLSMRVAPTAFAERWWIGNLAPAGWTAVPVGQLPTSPDAYLGVGLIALNNLPADAVSAEQQTALTRFVRELGGGLLILGGDHAFMAGGYAGSELESLSPLASAPPTPVMRWVLLIDSSGSMAAPWQNTTRFHAAVDAVHQLIPRLPANQLLSVGAFARDLRWWIENGSTQDAMRAVIPPPRTTPSGPTNLQTALQSFVNAKHRIPTRILILTDADATIDSPPALAGALRAADVQIDLLALSQIDASNPLARIATDTGGHWVSRADPATWSQALRNLMGAALPLDSKNASLQAHFQNELKLADRTIDASNRTWLKSRATSLAASREDCAIAAEWEAGGGKVVSLAFPPTVDELNAFAKRAEHPPRDPRYRISWNTGASSAVRIDASNANGYLNGLRLNVQLVGETISSPLAIDQIGPGVYALPLPRTPQSQIAVLRLDDRVLDRRLLAARYPPEFDAVGNDLPALKTLAETTGGEVIRPTQTTPIRFPWPANPVRLDSVLAFVGFILIAFAAIRSR